MSSTQPTLSLKPWTSSEVQFWSIVYIQAKRETVFRHLVDGSLTREYYFGMPISNPTAVGQEMWFGESRGEAAIVGKVTEFQFPEEFCHTFGFPSSDEPETLVEFRLLEKTPDLTILTIRHSGFASRGSEVFLAISEGWPCILSNLKTLLETGQALRLTGDGK